jgi:hypothetical protein
VSDGAGVVSLLSTGASRSAAAIAASLAESMCSRAGSRRAGTTTTPCEQDAIECEEKIAHFFFFSKYTLLKNYCRYWFEKLENIFGEVLNKMFEEEELSKDNIGEYLFGRNVCNKNPPEEHANADPHQESEFASPLMFSPTSLLTRETEMTGCKDMRKEGECNPEESLFVFGNSHATSTHSSEARDTEVCQKRAHDAVSRPIEAKLLRIEALPKEAEVVCCVAYEVDRTGWPVSVTDVAQHLSCFGEEADQLKKLFQERLHMFDIDPALTLDAIHCLVFRCSTQGQLVREVLKGLDTLGGRVLISVAV